ncbi:TonB-dependent receptor plug domain-containing protein [Filimonas effusa]|uniref:TonB-dependent receptor n=1 Tax=Filimonas effusa TaxID=2508721 RepID=A0A4Q1DAE0_9BACT|nr:TonB-dependent receptor [Filimonas effusa]RXK85449.1 TonB-dependent receptor [Filimonas effusa]
MKLKHIAFIAGSYLPVALQAQEVTTEKDLDPVTITATLNPVASSKTGRNLFVIKGEEISKYPVHSLDEMLRYLPGMEVQARGPMGAQSDFVVRGGTFQQVLVIIDGLRVNDPNTGHFNSYMPIIPSEIERIEVLKGASSAIYGSDAVGGVIHIITKAFARQQTKGQQIQAGVTSGAYGLLNANAGGYYSGDKWTFSAGAMSNNADGQEQRGINGFFHLHSFSASAGYKINDNWRVAYRSSYDSRRFAAQNFYTSFASDTATEKVNTLWNQLSVNYHKNNNNFSLQAGQKMVDDHYAYNKISTANNNRSTLWQALATYEHRFNDAVIFTGGAQYQRKGIRSNDRGNHTVQQAAAFAALNLEASEAFTISPALRLDWNERSGYELVPQINTSYRYGKLLVRASAGKTIRNADFTERYNNYNKSLVTSGRIGNPNLSAERSFSYEAGLDFFASKQLKIATTFFQRRHTDLVDWTTTSYADMPRKDNLSRTGTYALARNISKVNTTGVEADIIWQHSFNSKRHLSVTAGFVWLNSVTSDGFTSFYTSSHAKYLTNGMIRYNVGRFNISLNGIYKVRDAQAAAGLKGVVSKEYFVLNAKAGYFIIANKLNVFAQADNVFDKSYADLLGAQMPGRWLMGGLSFRL